MADTLNFTSAINLFLMMAFIKLFSRHFTISVLLAVTLTAMVEIYGCAGPESSDNSIQKGDGANTATDSDTGSQDTTSSNIITVTDSIETPTIWENRYIYVVRTNRLVVKNSLTIQPGTIIKFNPGASMETMESTDSDAVINAAGTIDAPIIFTSLFDDANGGDTNGDGNLTRPARSDWGNILIGHDAVFDYCRFLYGGHNQGSTVIISNSSSTDTNRAVVTNCVFAHNAGNEGGDYFEGALSTPRAAQGTVITNNRFYDNIVPLSVNPNCELDDSNTFQSEDGTMTNTYNAVFFNSLNNAIDCNLRFEETEVAIVLDQLGVSILSGFTVSLGDNVVIKFIDNGQMFIHDGPLALINYDGVDVYFTSIKDDHLKGDSNGDHTATMPADGDWDGIIDFSVPGLPAAERYVTWPNILYDSH